MINPSPENPNANSASAMGCVHGMEIPSTPNEDGPGAAIGTGKRPAPLTEGTSGPDSEAAVFAGDD